MKYKVAGRIQRGFDEAVGKVVRHYLKYGDSLDIEVVDPKGKSLKFIVIEHVRVEQHVLF
jgi:hypothetical protein